MKLISFEFKVKHELGLRTGAFISESGSILDFCLAIEGSPRDPLAWFDMEGEWYPLALQFYSKFIQNGEDRAGALVSINDVKLLAPVPRPPKVICIGLNYKDHAAESNMPVPKNPIVFSKFPTAIIGPGEPVILPRSSSQVDYEAELAIVIGRRGKHIAVADAFKYVLGYTIFNDISARDFQFSDGQWQRAKSCDTFAPMGEYIATCDEITDPRNLSIRLRLNGLIMQNSRTDQLVFGVAELIEFISDTITLEPGDIIATGTPPGVGFARKPPVFLRPGDVMEVEIERLGVLKNPVEAAR